MCALRSASLPRVWSAQSVSVNATAFPMTWTTAPGPAADRGLLAALQEQQDQMLQQIEERLTRHENEIRSIVQDAVQGFGSFDRRNKDASFHKHASWGVSRGAPLMGDGTRHSTRALMDVDEEQASRAQVNFLEKFQSDTVHGARKPGQQKLQRQNTMRSSYFGFAERRARLAHEARQRRRAMMFVFLPESDFRIVWDFVATLFIFFVAISLPYMIAFDASTLPAAGNTTASAAAAAAAASGGDDSFSSMALFYFLIDLFFLVDSIYAGPRTLVTGALVMACCYVGSGR